MGSASRVAAVVVTYNRKDLLKDCLLALLTQTYPLEQIFVIDNASTDGTQDSLGEAGILSNAKIKYCRLAQNTGGAGGFSEGLKQAHEVGYDWYWIMDDDATPVLDCLATLLTVDLQAPVGALCPKIIGSDGVPQIYHHKVIDWWGNEQTPRFVTAGRPGQLDANAFVGPLFSREAVDSFGYPDAGYFIWGDDTEYTWRVSKSLALFYVPNARIIHNDGKANSKSREYKDLWKREYMIRNAIHIRRKHGTAAQILGSVFLFVGMLLTWGRIGQGASRMLVRALCEGFRELDPGWRPLSRKF